MSKVENGVITSNIHNKCADDELDTKPPIQLELREEILSQVIDELAIDRAVELGLELAEKHMDRWKEELFYDKNGIFLRSFHTISDDSLIYEKNSLEETIKADYENIIRQVYAPFSVMWARWVADLETRIPNSKAVFFPRDGYLPAAAYEEIQRARGIQEEVPLLHLSRLGVGMKDEVDPQGNTVDKGREHYDKVLEYFTDIANKLRDEGKDTIIIADSLPYGYMMEALFERGLEGFIAQIGNVGRDWQEGTIPDELKMGLAQAFGLKTIPASFYSMSWLQQYGGTTIEGLPGILNIVANERIEGEPDYDKLEAIADGLETVHDRHDTVTNFTRKNGKVEPVLTPLPSSLGTELSLIADRVVREEANKMISNPGYGLTEPVATDMFYADMAKHLQTVMGYIETAGETGWSHGVLPQPLGRIKKHEDFIQYAAQMGSGMFPNVATYKDALSTVQSKV